MLTLLRTNSKATLRLSLGDLFPLVPTLLHRQLQVSRYYAPRSNSLVIQADTSRKQADNVHECFRKLEDLVVTAGKSAVRGETTPNQLAKVKKLYVLKNVKFVCRLLVNNGPDNAPRMKPDLRPKRFIVARKARVKGRALQATDCYLLT